MISKGLASAWTPIFDTKPIYNSKAAAYLIDFRGHYAWRFAVRPGVAESQRFLAQAPDSASGPDGLPYSAWHDLGLKGAEILHAVLQDLIDDIPMPIEFNDSAPSFLGKERGQRGP